LSPCLFVPSFNLIFGDEYAVMNPIKFWQVIKDDSKRTFEVCGQAGNVDSFTNRTYAMQKAGMNVSCMTPPITNKTSSKNLITITGYTREDGLYERLQRQFSQITLDAIDENDFGE